MTATRTSHSALRFAVAGALSAALLSGCAGSARLTKISDQPSEPSVKDGNRDVARAEARVQRNPNHPATRAALGQAYLKAGRFASAAVAFDDAMKLGDNSARTALSLALTYTASNRNREAVALLDDWREQMPAADLGLAMALAGETGRGVAILSDALRNGENTPKVRQNLAYAYALDGRWREARIMASQDVPADQIDQRISDWAMQARPEAGQQRVAALLGAPVRSDPGQPQRIALANTPTAEQLAAEASASQQVQPEARPVSATGELPPAGEQAAPAVSLDSYAPPAPAQPVAQIEEAPAPVAAPSAEAFRSAFAAPMPVEQPRAAPRRAAAYPLRVALAPAKAPRFASAATARGTHAVQLGSFSSPQGARRAWGIFAARNPELRNFRMVVTPAVVRGKNFWRVAAAGFDANSARSMCSSVRGRGGPCFAYAAPAAQQRGPAPVRGQAGPQMARRR